MKGMTSETIEFELGVGISIARKQQQQKNVNLGEAEILRSQCWRRDGATAGTAVQG